MIPIAVVGATASGKSALAVQLAEALGGEVVICDSVQIYAGFDVGAARPSAADMARVPHHLVGVVQPDAPFDAAQFCRLAVAALDAIAARGRRAILCGGTGLYVRALRYGLTPGVGRQPALRAALEQREQAASGALFAELLLKDPVRARQIGPTNRVRLIRALEIIACTGRPASQQFTPHAERLPVRPMALIQPVWPDATLRRRMHARIDAMLGAGLLDEARRLRAAFGTRAPALDAIGYREALACLDGALATKDLPGAILARTWAYGRRQRTWLRRELGVQSLPMHAVQAPCAHALKLVAG